MKSSATCIAVHPKVRVTVIWARIIKVTELKLFLKKRVFGKSDASMLIVEAPIVNSSELFSLSNH